MGDAIELLKTWGPTTVVSKKYSEEGQGSRMF